MIADTVERLGAERPCGCGDALATALITRPDAVPDAVKRDLAPIVGRYLPVRLSTLPCAGATRPQPEPRAPSPETRQ